VHQPFASPVRQPWLARVTKFGSSKNSSSDFPLCDIFKQLQKIEIRKIKHKLLPFW
jgi:hypothetical protein